MRVTVRRIVSENALGVIFSGRVEDERHPHDGRPVRVRAPARALPGTPVVGDVWHVEGTLHALPGHGDQVEASRLRREMPGGELVRAFLVGRVPGIGPERARALWVAFGDTLGQVLSDEGNVPALAEALASERPVLAARLAAMAVAAWRQAGAEVAVVEWLAARGVTNLRVARRVIKILGPDAVSSLEANPYCLAALLPWAAADALGLSVLRGHGSADPKRDRRRLVGASDAVVRLRIADGGHTAATSAEVRRGLAVLLGSRSDPALVDDALEAAVANGAFVPDGQRDGYRFPGCATMEDAVSAKLAKMLASGPGLSRPELKALMKGPTLQSSELHPEQQAAVLEVLARPVACLQGGAGTGKTHATRAICAAWESLGGSTVLGALSGKAALRLGRASGRPTRTLARLLVDLDERRRLMGEMAQGGARSRPELAGRLATLPELDARTLLVLDEASMVDLATVHRLLQHLPDGAHILLVGDDAQLPPVSAGLVYQKLVEDPEVTTRLTVVHRQTEESGIPAVAAAIRTGTSPALARYSGIAEGVFFVTAPLPRVADTVLRVASDLGGVEADVLVVTATRGRAAGTDALNEAFQKTHVDTNRVGLVKGLLGGWFSVGDPVIHLRNAYDIGLWNGSMGRVVEVDEVLRRVVATFEGRRYTFTLDGTAADLEGPVGGLIDIALSYAVTCHKAQGSSAQRVLVPIYRSAVLSRSWLYTAVTRAEKQAVLIGDEAVLRGALEGPWAAEQRRVGFRWPWATSPPAEGPLRAQEVRR